MKQLLTIFLLLLLFASLYNRQLIFLQCSAVNSFQPLTLKCDCLNEPDDNNAPPINPAIHIHSDDLFTLVKRDFYNIDFTIFTKNKIGLTEKEVINFSEPLFHPPRA